MRILAILALAGGLLVAAPSPAPAQEGVVHAILFYSPTCPHCHEVINRDLPPLRQRFGDRFVIVGVDVTTPGGQELYQATVAYFALPESRLGVPALVVGPSVLVGSQEIPDRLPGIIERGVATGGIDWPPVDRVRAVLREQGIIPAPATGQADAAPPAADPPTEPAAERPATTPEAGPAAPETPAETGRPGPDALPTSEATDSTPADGAGPVAGPSDTSAPAPSADPTTGLNTALDPSSHAVSAPTMGTRFLQDPVGNGVAVAVLTTLLLILVWSARTSLSPQASGPVFPVWVVPVLAVVGVGIAAYLSFVEVTGAQAVCGPVGDCNTVQQSAYARLFGVLPVGVLGLAGYLALVAAWGVGRFGPAGLRGKAVSAAWAMAFLGTLFSAYLTFLEPFVIGATCAWCVSSALVMAALLVGTTGELGRGGTA